MLNLHHSFRLWHTVRHLRPVQITNRLRRKLVRPKPAPGPAPELRERSSPPTGWAQRPALMSGPTRLRVFQKQLDLNGPSDWTNPQFSHLEQYNLHYFDDLTADGASQRTEWHQALIDRWIAENPPIDGAGWEPYPLSLRIVNWIKWSLSGHRLSATQMHSLAVQTRALLSQLEYHLLGNHLLANAKALTFAGHFFSGPEADRWLSIGTRLLCEQLAEQVLADGGHFELSPMYHSIILEDVLDVLNLLGVYPAVRALAAEQLSTTAQAMRVWLQAMTHPDGQISFFNDAALNIAVAPTELDAYAIRIGLPLLSTLGSGVIRLPNTGYLRVQYPDHVLICDVGNVGPDYQPGHSHADTLSFEWSWHGQRVLVNSGTSLYGTSAERLRQRSTSAHNTVEVDGQDSSEVWGGFRLARRARPCGLSVTEEGGRVTVECAHDGYRRLKGRVTHRRRWIIEHDRLTWHDHLDGAFGQAVGRIHWYPGWTLTPESGPVRFSASREKTSLEINVQHSQGCISATSFHPEFGVEQKNQCLETVFLQPEQRISVHWPC